MSLKQRILAFTKTGLFIIEHYGARRESENILHQGLDKVIDEACLQNPWFTQTFVKESLLSLASMLSEKELQKLCEQKETNEQKTVALICAGNIPCVAFHDVLCTLLSGHTALIKLSSDDALLLPFFLKLLVHYEPSLEQNIRFTDRKMNGFDAVIATGSNNSAQYFEQYFGKYPHIIRKNRSSVAILDGSESKEDLKALGLDIFLYFGLGCRNVSKLLVPKEYQFDLFFESIIDYAFVVNNNKYANNYEYQRAILLLESEKFLDNNFLILRNSANIHAPTGCLYYENYNDKNDLASYLKQNKNEIQCIVGKGYTPFGYSQSPVITDFADGINTWDFLVSL